MTEELVTLKTAKILKEKGFNEFCKDIINDNGKLMETVYRTNNDLPKSFLFLSYSIHRPEMAA